MVSVSINFTANPAINYVITYKKNVDTIWITPPGNPTNTTPFIINGLDENTLYDFRVQTNCGIVTVQKMTDEGSDTIWIEDTFTCEQDTPFTLADTYTGFSSPFGLYWDTPSQRFYVVDCDNSNGTFWWFDPNTITGVGSSNYIPGSITNDINIFAIDKVNRRILSAGDNSGGALVLDIASNTVSTLSYGTNVGGTGGNGRRTPLGLSNDKFYAFSKSPDNFVRIYDRNTLTFQSQISISSIPSNGTYVSGGYNIQFIGSEIWFIAASRANGNIGRYNNDLTTLNGTITLTGIATAFSGGYWQQSYYDVDNNKLYVGDSGSHRLFVIDTTTNAVISNTVIPNLNNKNYCDFNMIKSELDGQIYAQVRGLNSLGDSSPSYKLYRINPTTGQIIFIYPNSQGSQLTLRTGTNEQWAVDAKVVIWNVPNTGYNTDGLILKYTS